MCIKKEVNSILSERDSLVASGISPVQALEIASEPLKIKYLNDVFTQLTLFQREALMSALIIGDYVVNDSKASVSGIVVEDGRFRIEFSNLLIGGEDFSLELNELPNELVDDITSILGRAL